MKSERETVGDAQSDTRSGDLSGDLSGVKRLNFETDDAFFRALMEDEMAQAVRGRERIGYTGQFRPRISMTLEAPDFAVRRILLSWTGREEKYKTMQFVAYIARICDATSILLATDTRMVMLEKFQEYFKLGPYDPGPKAMERMQEDYLRILEEKFGGTMQNLPRELWSESINVSLKTPTSMMTLIKSYIRGSNGKVQWTPMGFDSVGAREGDRVLLNLIQDWWLIPHDSPALVQFQEVAETILEQMDREKDT